MPGSPRGREVFPTVQWEQMQATFAACGDALPEAPVRAALVFAVRHDDRFVLADIRDRGWCIPGGHLEAGETAEEAVRRETLEETGATLGNLHLMGHFILTVARAPQIVPTYAARVVAQGLPAPDSESAGMREAPLESLPSIYYRWDLLLETVFAYALATLRAAEQQRGEEETGT